MVPEITVAELSRKLTSEDEFVLLDVRELNELKSARLTDIRLEVVPMSRLAREGETALPESANSKEATIYVMCHHGNRSGHVATWLIRQGWKNVFSVQGGIDEYARKVDKSIGIY